MAVNPQVLLDVATVLLSAAIIRNGLHTFDYKKLEYVCCQTLDLAESFIEAWQEKTSA